MAFDFVAAFAESPIPFFVAGDTTTIPQLSEAPQQVTLRFSPGVQIDAASIGGSIGFVRSVNGVLGDTNDLSVMPVAPVGSVTVGDLPNENEVVIRFAETLPDDLYRFTITSGLRAIGGDVATAFQFDVRFDLGAFVTAVVPQPVERQASGSLVQHRDRVEVHFNAGDPLNQASAQTPAFYRLVPVSASGADGTPVAPAAVSYSAAAARAVLDFAPGAIADGTVYRLEIGTTLSTGTPTPFAFSGAADDDNSSFVTATPLGGLAANGIFVAARIDDRPSVATPAGSLAYPGQPGTLDEPGHRDMPADSGFHGLPNLETTPLWPSWVLSRAADGPVGFYNFRPDYGRDPQGNPLTNTITEVQKQRTREVFDLFGAVTGIRFVEEVRAPYAGLTVATGDIRAIDPAATPGPGGVIGIAGSSRIGTGLFSRAFPAVVMDAFEDWGSSEYGGAWFETAMHEIGHALGLPHSYDLPSIMGAGLTGEKVYPGDYDTIHLRQLFPTNGTDIDVYSVTVAEPGSISAETFAARPGSPVTSFLDTVISLYREEVVGTATVRTLVARNDDSVGRDSFVGLEVKPGKYFVVVTSTGNEQFNPEAADTGSGGRTRGPYELRLGFTPAPSATATIVDARRTPLDGDRDGLPGGTHAFWFTTASAAETVFVDKLGPATGADGTLAKPYRTISAALSAVTTANAAASGSRKIVRIVGNDAQTPYLLGTTTTNQPLADGSTFNVPKGVTVMIDAGAVFKLRSAVIDVGSSQPLPSTSRAGAALQVLGVPSRPVTFTSYHDDSIGGNSDGAGPVVQGGQWGGIVLRKDSDVSAGGSTGRAWLNSISNAALRYGGGQVRVDAQLQAFAPIQIEGTRPTVAFNTITDSAGAAIAATPNSFEDSRDRVGPEIRGNRLLANAVNGLFVKIFTRFGSPLEQLDVAARFRSTDVVYVLQENLLIAGGVGGSRLDVAAGGFSSRATGRLTIDPGVIVKLQNSRIELERGASRLMAEGTESSPVILTSLGDNRYGAGGTFDTNGNIPDIRTAGDWGGIVLNAGARASIDRAYVAFGGGLTPIEGTSDFFNVIEVHQGDLRLTNSRIENNLDGLAGSDRTGRGTNAAATIFIRGAQPTIVGNDFRANAGAVISVNANSLSDVSRPDGGRSTGPIERFDRYDDNVGPLVAGNVLAYTNGTAALAGMKIRGEEITVESVWDDTDIVHVLEEEIIVRNFHTATGLRLQSKPDSSLVVKLRGATAGLTAEGYGLDIDERIGGTVQIVGQPGRPVVLTSLADDTVGASVDPLGRTVTDTGNDGSGAPAAGDWRSLLFLPLSNDRNVSISVEAERPLTSGVETNAGVDAAEDLGTLAPNFATGTNSWESAQEKSGDENRRLGFEVHGFVAADDPTDVDVYSFQGYAGSEVWIDVDKTAAGLDAMVELLDSFGNVLARSADEAVESQLASEAVADGVGGSSVTYTLAATGIVQGTFVGTLRDGSTGLAIQDFAIAADGSATFYDRLPASAFHATEATLDPASGLLTLTFDQAAGPTVVEVSYVHATGALSTETLGLGLSAQRDGWRGGDFYTTNPRDPGMRVVLPGSTGQQLRYFVRVRSQPRQDAATLARFNGATPLERYESSLRSGSFDQPGDPAAGATSGRYELRVRLRQRDEKPGSAVRYADIRFPNIGIDVRGLPRNALLAGETGETNQTNGAFTESQYVGNLLESDRNTISIAGALASSTDVDWYRFSLNFEQIQGTSPPPTWATVFDIDYADGFRGDLTLAVFDAAGRLLYVGRDSDVRDDQPGAGQGNDLDDLSRGSLGKLDPFLGTVQLPTDNPKGSRDVPANPAAQLTYYVAVMSNGQLPSQLDATFQSAAGNVLVRLEPVTSIKRVVEDHIGFTGYTSERAQVDQTTLDPVSGNPRPLIDISSTTSLSANVRPFTIADVTLFVSTSSGIYTVDAMTGVRETTLRTGITGITLGDLDMRTDGRLYAYAGVNNNATTAGTLIEINAGTGVFDTAIVDGYDNIKAPGDPPSNYQTDSNTVTALAFRRTRVAVYDELWFIVRDGDNSKLYRAADGGSATAAADPTADQSYDDSKTLGYRGSIKDTIVTGLQFANDADQPAPASPTADVPTVYGVTDDGRFIAILAGEKIADDGTKDDQGNVVDPPTDFEATVTVLGDFTQQLQAEGLTGFQGLAAAPRNLDGGRFAGMFVAVAVGRVASGVGQPTYSARLCIIDPATNGLVRLTEWGPGTAAKPGELFSPALEVGSLSEITGLAFSPLDVNLWHPTERRGDTDRDTVQTPDPGHGITAASDNSRRPNDVTRSVSITDVLGQPLESRSHAESAGGVSMYFGLERYQSSGTPSYLRTAGGNAQNGTDPSWHEDLTTNPSIGDNYNLPGGAYGSLITNPFSLAGYAYTDKPTLYFNYWLDTEGVGSKTSLMRDSARVLISVDQGVTWELLATNNSTRSASGTADAELPTVISASSAVGSFANQHVQELFEAPAVTDPIDPLRNHWRQARVDLGKWAGNADIRLRFDFHTAGEFDPDQVDAAGNLINTISGRANETGNFNSIERGQKNEFEGFYVDDIVVGFAERGEMVTAAAADSTGVFAVATPPGGTPQALQGPYQLEIRRGTDYSLPTRSKAAANPSADMQVFRTLDTNQRLIPGAYTSTGELRGDSNQPREQGQFVIDGNVITSAATYGISIDAGARDAVSNTPHPGVARNLPTLNSARLVPGAFVVNNVVSSSGVAGILFSGDSGGDPAAVVPFGRIVNNTIYGGTTPRGVGVQVSDSAGPTLMNNLFANLVSGVTVDASSQRDAAGNERTVVTRCGFSGVTTPVSGVTDRFRVTLSASPFVNAAAGNFYLVAGTPAIDTSLDALQDRNEFLVVNSAIGAPPAPILAPEKDLYGQVRWYDPDQAPGAPGLGADTFKDLGAIDRVDLSQSPPYIAILEPRDGGVDDFDVVDDVVELRGSGSRNLRFFSFQVVDQGAGIDPATVVASAFTLTRNGTPLVSGRDYVFRFVESANRVVFEAASVFTPGIYRILVASTVVDRAGNPLRPNNLTTGATEFEIRLLDVPYAPAWPAPMSPLAPVSPLLAGWHENQRIHLGWSPAFTVLPSLPILDYDVEMSTDNFLTPGLVVTPAGSTTATALTLPGLVNGSQYWFRVRATNGLGTGPWSDIIGPIVPQPIPSIALAADTGSDPADGTTQNGRVNVTGIATGARWQYRFAGGAWTDGSGTSFTLPDSTYPAGDVQVRQIAGGFPSVPATNPGRWIIDTGIPHAPVITSVTDDVSPVTGTIASGGSTNDTTPTFDGTAEAGTTLRITVNGGTPITITVPAGGAWTYTPTLASGFHAFSFIAVDAAGNESPAATYNFTVDTVAPATPVITSVTDNVSPVTGTTAFGGFTNDPTPTFSGIADAGVGLRVVVNGGTPALITVPAGGIWTFTPAALGDGAHTFSFTAVDAAGNESPTATVSLTVDTVAPAAPVITSVADDVTPMTGSIANGGMTNDRTPAFTGSAEAGATLRITVNGGTPTTIAVPAGGTWTYTPAALVDGAYTFSFTAIDVAGNESPTIAFGLTVNTVAPPAPVITSVADDVSPINGSIANGGTTNDSTPTFTGTAPAGMTLRVIVNGGTPVFSTVPAGGTWTYTPPSLVDGNHSFSFTAIDAAGNRSLVTTFSLTVDTAVPQITSILATSPTGTYGIGQAVDIQVTFSEAVAVSGVPTLLLNTTPSRSAEYVSGGGTSVVTFRYTIRIGDRAPQLDYASISALTGGSFTDSAGNAAPLPLPATGAFLGRTIVVDALIKATVPGLGQWPNDPPDVAAAVAAFQVQFNTAVTGFTTTSISLQRLADPADPTSGRPVSLAGISITGGGTSWTINLPSSSNPTSLKGRYKLVIGGVGSGIQADGIAMDTPVEWYFDRI